MNRTLTAALGAATLVACGGKGDASAPWLTMPSRASHQSFFPISSRAHASATCADCHSTVVAGGPALTSFKQFECRGCHTNDVTTDVVAGTTTDAMHGGLAGYAWDSATCLNCHPTGQGIAPTNHSTALFPIDASSKHAGFDCSSCHTLFASPGNPAATNAALACASCHAKTKLAIPATPAAHANVTLTAPMTSFATLTAADCLMCHADDTVTRVATHGAGLTPAVATPFAISGAAAHAKSACLACHVADGAPAPTMRTDKSWAVDFSRYTCLSCHDQTTTTANHSGVTGFIYGTASCLGCHPGGAGGEPPTHPALFPIGSDPGSQHPGFACASCHTTPGVVGNPAATIAGLDCVTCHATTTAPPPTATGHASVGLTGGKTWATVTSLDCLTCHADSQVNAVASHVTRATPAAFPIPHSTPANGGAGTQCLTCHQVARTDKPFGQNFAVWTCASTCHQSQLNGNHERVTPAPNTTNCYQCHANGGGG